MATAATGARDTTGGNATALILHPPADQEEMVGSEVAGDQGVPEVKVGTSSLAWAFARARVGSDSYHFKVRVAKADCPEWEVEMVAAGLGETVWVV